MRTIDEIRKPIIKRPVFLLVAASLLHVAVAASVLTIGKLQLMPAKFASNGVGQFASDGFAYQDEAIGLVDVLEHQGLAAWVRWPTQLHVRFYSLPLVVLYRWIGFNVLAIEPLNLFYYLAILTLVFRLGLEIFDYRAGLLAAAIVAVWPSLLLHTTQLLRDPLLITVVLLLILIAVKGLKRDYSWWRGLLAGIVAALALVVIRIVRLPMWDLTQAIVWLFTLFLIVRLVRERRVLIGNLGLAAIMIAAVAITPHFQPWFRNQQNAKAVRRILPEQIESLPLAQRIAVRRDAFGSAAESGENGSPIDDQVRFEGVGNIVRYIPRAVAIGLFAPFPGMWFSSGVEVGLGGRLLAGVETLLTYIIEGLAVVGWWRARRELPVWLVALVVGMGIVALGLVVKNIGALYRLRYSFWILIVVLGAGGALYLLRQRSIRRSQDRSSLDAE